MISDSISPSGIVHVMSAELCVMSEDVMREGGRGDIWGGCEGVRVCGEEGVRGEGALVILSSHPQHSHTYKISIDFSKR